MSQIFAKKRPFSGPSGPPDPIVCDKCHVTFSMRKNLYSHMRNVHSEEVNATGKQSCGLCDNNFRTISQLCEHLQTQHNVKLKFNDFTFYSETDFLEWKKKIEMEEQSSFVLRNSSKKRDIKFIYYACHRSGVYNSKEDRIRHLKTSGSVKIGCTCPAVMNVSSQTVGEVVEIKVNYQSVHVGHDKDVGKMKLTKEEKLTLASSLKLGIPMAKILDETRKQYSPTKRFGFTTRKDLHNIQSAFHINKDILHKDDATSVALLVKKMQEDNYDPILIYKPVGEALEHFPAIDKSEFLLGIMNEAQQKLLELYGRCVMIDSTHGLNQYGFQLTTVMVNDENHEGLPVATLFSTRTAAETFVPFFSEIKKRVPDLKTVILMSDDTNAFCNAWQTVFNNNFKHLLCSWHIVKNWNLNIHSKVRDNTNKEKIKLELNKILHETDLVTYQRLVNDFMCYYVEKEKNFVNYFQNNYLKRPEKWAYCYRIGLQINTNMKLERWHRQLKYEESGGTVIKRLDKALITINNAVAKKLLSRVISMERGKLTSRVALIRRRHKTSLEMSHNYNVVELGDKFVVTKTNHNYLETYELEKLEQICICPIRCDLCNICIHTFSCTCVDYSIRFIICKHAHYIAQNYKSVPTEAPIEVPVEDSLIIDINSKKARKELEKEMIDPQLRIEKSDIQSKKNKMLQSLEGLKNRLLTCESEDVFQFAEENINAINAYMDISNQPNLSAKILEVATAPKNKLISKQRDLFTNKKLLNKK